MGRRILAVIAALLIMGSARAEIKLFAVNVGKGDALFLLDGDYVAMIDTGRKKAREDVLSAMALLNIDHIDDLFITHGDKDHAGGRKWLNRSDIKIGAVYTSAYADVEDAVRLSVGDVISTPRGRFTVLAPVGEAADEDDNSLVTRFDSSDGSILLAGDMELAEEESLLKSGANLACDVLKVPNHGDGDACGDALVSACGAKVAIISTSSVEKPGTPDAAVIERLSEAGEVYVTEDSDIGILTVLDRGGITVTIK